MTTNSIAYIGRAATERLKESAPAVAARIVKITGHRIGRVRLARVWFRNPEGYAQYPMGPLGTITGHLITELANNIEATCSFPAQVHQEAK